MVVPASLRKEAGTTYYEISVHLSAAKLLLQAVGAHSIVMPAAPVSGSCVMDLTFFT